MYPTQSDTFHGVILWDYKVAEKFENISHYFGCTCFVKGSSRTMVQTLEASYKVCEVICVQHT